MVKWPNDVWLEGRKLAGILIEAKPQDAWAVIGVGLNLSIEPEEFPPDLRQPATSLGGSVTPEEARRALDEQLGRWVDAAADEALAEWRRRDGLHGRAVSWEGGSGVADGIDDRGNLVVVIPGGRRFSLGAGEVQLRL
jgi:BirA family transcriptional regulator, biotin operon repressor / biotin---[acetyl-CoA-carboxylase] ligase